MGYGVALILKHLQVTADVIAEGAELEDLHDRLLLACCHPHDLRSTTRCGVISSASKRSLLQLHRAFDYNDDLAHEQVTNLWCETSIMSPKLILPFR